VYDAIGAGAIGAAHAAGLLQWLRAAGHAPRDALDLACGTGAAALVLAEAGLRVVGVDHSAAMLRIATGRSRDAGYAIHYAEGDMRALPSSLIPHPSSFDLVTLLGDGLRELTGDEDLRQLFCAAARRLRSGGHLAFEVAQDNALDAWDEQDLVSYDGSDTLVYRRRVIDRKTRLGEERIVWFVRETDCWWRGEETHPARLWSEDEIVRALDAAGLERVATVQVREHSLWIAGAKELENGA
jgi:SAM-dependent methyltransferase